MNRMMLLVALATLGSAAVIRQSPGIARQLENIQRDDSVLVKENARAISDIEQEQNKNAFYHFESAIDDKINDQTQSRTETREGDKVKGSFSYSDGFHKRTVMYEADKDGYRVVGENIEPLEGPKVNVDGSASVHAAAHGNDLRYTIQSFPGQEENTRIFDVARV